MSIAITFLLLSVFGLGQVTLTKKAPVDVYVFDFHKSLKSGERITLFNKSYRFSGVTDSTGKFRITLQGGETYMVLIHGFGYEEEYSTFTVPDARAGSVYPISRLKISYNKPMKALKRDVLFHTGSDSLGAQQLKEIRSVADYMTRKPASTITVKGFTDNVGSEISNMDLSVRRTEAVIAELERLGVSKDRLKIQSYGETQPRSSNATESGRSKNRRVELALSN